MPTPETIAVAMSGGVDSSTVAAMLKSEGYNLVGLTLQLWNQRRLAGRPGMPETSEGRCCSLDDVYDARRVAEHLDIPYYVVNQQDRFEQDVVQPFVQEYLSGRTPVPCTLCNNHLKFAQLLDTARQIGAERIATGHYARNEYDPARDRWILKRPADASKDQTYFLFGLTQEAVEPQPVSAGQLSEAGRPHDRASSRDWRSPTSRTLRRFASSPAATISSFSTRILLIAARPCRTPAAILSRRRAKWLGIIEGIHNFTVGQRKGLGVATGSPLYVIGINGADRKVVVGSSEDLTSKTLRANRLNWISIPRLEGTMRLQVKIRHRHEAAWASLEMSGDDEVTVTFDQPQRAVTPGQAAVFYDGDEVAGGGWIL